MCSVWLPRAGGSLCTSWMLERSHSSYWASGNQGCIQLVYPQWLQSSSSKRLPWQHRPQATGPLSLFASEHTALHRGCTGTKWLPLGVCREDFASSGVSCLGQKARWKGTEWGELTGSHGGVEQTSGNVTVPKGNMQKRKGVGRTGRESVFRFPSGKGPEPWKPSRLQEVVKGTAQSQSHHAACWARQWGSVIGPAPFALWGCSANVRL